MNIGPSKISWCGPIRSEAWFWVKMGVWEKYEAFLEVLNPAVQQAEETSQVPA